MNINKPVSTLRVALYMVLLLISLSCVRQKTFEFYVSPDGSDANPGTKSAPFKSLEKTKESIKAILFESTGGQSK